MIVPTKKEEPRGQNKGYTKKDKYAKTRSGEKWSRWPRQKRKEKGKRKKDQRKKKKTSEKRKRKRKIKQIRVTTSHHTCHRDNGRGKQNQVTTTASTYDDKRQRQQRPIATKATHETPSTKQTRYGEKRRTEDRWPRHRTIRTTTTSTKKEMTWRKYGAGFKTTKPNKQLVPLNVSRHGVKNGDPDERRGNKNKTAYNPLLLKQREEVEHREKKP